MDLLTILLIGGIGLGTGILAAGLIFSRRDTKSQTPAIEENSPPPEAKDLLEKAGYKIKDTAKKATIITKISGKSHLGYVQADYILEKKGKTYAAKVKSGEVVDATEPITRRQLIEYDYAFKPEALVLVDTGKGEIHEVSFKVPKEAREYFIQFAIVFFVVFVVLGIIWLMIQLKLF